MLQAYWISLLINFIMQVSRGMLLALRLMVKIIVPAWRLRKLARPPSRFLIKFTVPEQAPRLVGLLLLKDSNLLSLFVTRCS